MNDLLGSGGVGLVIGPPGVGKTTWLAAQVRHIVYSAPVRVPGSSAGCPVLLCSLTKTAALEIAGRDMPIPVEAIGTVHAHCYRSLDKPSLLTGGAVEEWNHRYPFWAVAGDDNAGGLDEASGEMPFGDMPGDAMLSAYQICRQRMLAEAAWPDGVIDFAQAWEEYKTSAGLVDFIDLVSQCYYMRVNPPMDPSVIIVDEAQDMSALEMSLLRRWGEHAGTLIVVGDPFQALYTWRGADPRVFTREFHAEEDSLSERAPLGEAASPVACVNVQVRRLRRSYRVPARVLDASLAWLRCEYRGVVDVDYLPRQEDGVDVAGVIVRGVGFSSRAPEAMLDDVERRIAGGASVMIEASCGYMLRSVLAVMRSRGIMFSNPWRPARLDWNPVGARGISLLHRVASFLRSEWRRTDIARWAEPLRATGVFKQGKKAALVEAMRGSKDLRAVSIIELGEWFTPAALEDISRVSLPRFDDGAAIDWYGEHLLAKYQKRFLYVSLVLRRYGRERAMERPRLFVGTIHSFKGAEADAVYLMPDLSKASAMAFGSSDDEAHNAVVRMVYVGMTRARCALVLCDQARGSSAVRWEVCGV